MQGCHTTGDNSIVIERRQAPWYTSSISTNVSKLFLVVVELDCTRIEKCDMVTANVSMKSHSQPL
jgi:hypothetical protein